MLANKLKKKRPITLDMQTISFVESQWKRLINHLEASRNATPTETPSNTIEKPVDQETIASKPPLLRAAT